MASVPCGSCHLCCKKTAVLLMPGDDPALYDTEQVLGDRRMVRHKPNGDCIYLDANGCTIHDHAPIMCREYDCRAQFAMYTRDQRRALVREGKLDPEVLKRGWFLIKEQKKGPPKWPEGKAV